MQKIVCTRNLTDAISAEFRVRLNLIMNVEAVIASAETSARKMPLNLASWLKRKKNASFDAFSLAGSERGDLIDSFAELLALLFILNNEFEKKQCFFSLNGLNRFLSCYFFWHFSVEFF